jgi:branched-chain amino acid transport system permease protein
MSLPVLLLDDKFVRTLFDGVTIGALYALIAVGYTMVYGIIKLINFAHGEIFMVGAFGGLLVVNGLAAAFGGPDTPPGAFLLFVVLCVALVASMAACAALGWSIDLVAYRPLRKATRLAALITAIGISLSLQTLVQMITADYWNYPSANLPGFLDTPILAIGAAELLWKEFAIILAAAVLMIGLDRYVHLTKMGKAMRACALDKDTSALMGINVNRVIATTFMIGSAMAAIAGILQGIKVGGNINFRFGYYPGLIAFAAAVLGGIGNLRGAVLGGVVIGFTRVFLGAYISPDYDFSFAFGVMILTILFRPWGLLGQPEAKRA